MKAISLWQPWASAIALRHKLIETRHWSTSYRGLIAIHAAKRWTAAEREEADFFGDQYDDRLRRPPLGVIVAVAVLAAIKPTEVLVRTATPKEQSFGNFGPKRFGWLLEDIRRVPEPIPFSGAQGLFEVPDSVFPAGFILRRQMFDDPVA